MAKQRAKFIWAGGVFTMLASVGCLIVFYYITSECGSTACLCDSDPPCESWWVDALGWLGFAFFASFLWFLDKVLKEHSPIYRHVARYGNIHVEAEREQR